MPRFYTLLQHVFPRAFKDKPRRRRLRFDRLEERRLLALAAGDLDTSFHFDGKTTTDFGIVEPGADAVNDVAYQSDGKFVVLGESNGSGAIIDRYNADGSVDPTFGIAGRVFADVAGTAFQGASIAVDSSDRIIIAGTSALGDSPQGHIGINFGVVRLKSDGSLDTTFSGDGKQTIDFGDEDRATSVAVDSTDRVVVVGTSGFTGAVARLNADGALDTSFSGDGKQIIGAQFSHSVAIDSADRIVIAGAGAGASVARLTLNGSLDTTFSDDGMQDVFFPTDGDLCTFNVAVDSADRVVVAGTTFENTLTGWNFDFAVARLTTNGALDTSFSGDGKQTIELGSLDILDTDIATSVAVDSAGRIVIAGYVASFETSVNDFAVARLSSDGALDTTFSGDGKQTVDFGNTTDVGKAVAVDSSDRIILVGDSGQPATRNDFALARLTVAGVLDTTFNSDGMALTNIDRSSNDTGRNVAAYQSDGKFIVIGQIADTFGTPESTGIVRYNADGSLDTSFGSGGKVIFQTNLDPYGVPDPNGPFSYYAVAVDHAGRIVVAGYLRFNAGFSVGRLNGDGSWDTTFGEGGEETLDFGNDSEFGLGISVDTANRILIAGTTAGPGGRDFAVVRVNVDGTLDTSFGEDGQQTVDFGEGNDSADSVAIDSAGRIVVSGVSYQTATGFDFAVTRLSGDGSLDVSFGAGGTQTIDFGSGSDVGYSVALDSADRVVLAGDSYQLLTGYDFAVARLDSDGQLDASFGADGKQLIDFDSLFDHGYSIAVDSADRVVVAGSAFQGDADSYDFAVTRLNNAGSLDASFSDDGRQTIDFGNTYDFGNAVLVDAVGRIVVAGSSYSPDGDLDYAVARLIGSTDSDGDGIANSIDAQPTTFSNSFSDGASTGTIVSRGDQLLSITDSPDPTKGVVISASSLGGSAPATISIDGGAATLTLTAGDSITATHGSVILHVESGTVEAAFSGATGQTATATLTDESTPDLTFKPDTFSFIAPATNTEPVAVTANGNTLTVSPGQTVQAVHIDVIPGSSINTLNIDSNGVIQVAIYSSADFDAAKVNVGSVLFAGAHPVQNCLKDLNGDGRTDLLLNFRTQDTTLKALYSQLLIDDKDADGILDSTHQTASVSLTGQTVDSVFIEGFDQMDLFLAGKSLRDLLSRLFP